MYANEHFEKRMFVADGFRFDGPSPPVEMIRLSLMRGRSVIIFPCMPLSAEEPGVTRTMIGVARDGVDLLSGGRMRSERNGCDVRALGTKSAPMHEIQELLEDGFEVYLTPEVERTGGATRFMLSHDATERND